MSKNVLITGVDYLASSVRNGSVLFDGPSDVWSGTAEKAGGIIAHGNNGDITSVVVFGQDSRDVETSYTFNESGSVDTVTSHITGDGEESVVLYASHNYDDNGALVSSDVVVKNGTDEERHLFLYCDNGEGCLDALGHGQEKATVIDINLETGKIVERAEIGVDCKIDIESGEMLSKEDVEALAETGDIVLPEDWEDISSELPEYEDINPDAELNPDDYYEDGTSDK